MKRLAVLEQRQSTESIREEVEALAAEYGITTEAVYWRMDEVRREVAEYGYDGMIDRMAEQYGTTREEVLGVLNEKRAKHGRAPFSLEIPSE